MTNEKEAKDITQNTSNQGENVASSSREPTENISSDYFANCSIDNEENSKGKGKEQQPPKQDLILSTALNLLTKNKLPEVGELKTYEEMEDKKIELWYHLIDRHWKDEDEEKRRIFSNLLSHTYSKEEAEEIFAEIKKYKTSGEFSYFADKIGGNIEEEKLIYGRIAENRAKVKMERQVKRITETAINYQNEVIQGLEMIKNEITKEREEKEKEIWELAEEIEKVKKIGTDKENELNKKIAETAEKSEQLEQELADWKKEEVEAKQREAEALGEKLKAIESKEKVELTEITEKYRNLEQNTQGIAEQLELKDKKITEFIQLINYQEKEKVILGHRYSILNKERGIIAADCLQLKNEKARIEVELNSEKRQRTNDINAKIRDLETWQIKFDTEKHGNEKKHQEIQKKILEIRDLNKEIIALKLEKKSLNEEITRTKRDNNNLVNRIEEVNKEKKELAEELTSIKKEEKKGGEKFSVENIFLVIVLGIGILVLLWIFSLIWKWVIKPIYRLIKATINNFRGEKERKKGKRIAEEQEEKKDKEAEALGEKLKAIEIKETPTGKN